MSLLALGFAGSPASALTLGGPVDGVAVDSFVFDHAGEVLREYVVATAAGEQGGCSQPGRGRSEADRPRTG